MRAVADSGVIAGCTLSFTVITGASPHAPRHDTVSTVKSPSSVVFLPSVRPSLFQRAFKIGMDFLTWQAVPSHILITYLPLGSSEKFS